MRSILFGILELALLTATIAVLCTALAVVRW